MKNLDKVLSRTIYTYFVALIIIFILKICGLDYFGLDTSNKIITNIDCFVEKYYLEIVFHTLTLYIYTFVILSITCKDNSRSMKIYTLCVLPFCVGIQLLKENYNIPMMFIFTDLLWLLMVSICYIKLIKRQNIEKYNISNYFIYCVINIFYQALSVATRNVTIENTYSFSESLLMNFDYLLLTLITYKLFFMKGGINLWEWVVGLFSHLQTSLKSLPIKLQSAFATSKSKSKFEQISNMIYIPLYLMWNVFTLTIVLFVAFLNETFIECMLILFSFWLNKKVFGKPFHMKTAISCFAVSNLTYYCLNRITISSGLSLFISVLLGILLDYITSYFVKEKKLYRGMSLELFDETIINVVDKNSDEYKICKMFYVEKQSDQYIATRLNYSKSSIEKKKHNIVAKLKEL